MSGDPDARPRTYLFPMDGKTRKVVLDGPPWCGFVDPEEAYLRRQVAQVGSGALGGWSAATSGGSFTENEPRQREVRAELGRKLAQPSLPEPTSPARESWRSRLSPARREREGQVQTLRAPTAR